MESKLEKAIKELEEMRSEMIKERDILLEKDPWRNIDYRSGEISMLGWVIGYLKGR